MKLSSLIKHVDNVRPGLDITFAVSRIRWKLSLGRVDIGAYNACTMNGKVLYRGLTYSARSTLQIRNMLKGLPVTTATFPLRFARVASLNLNSAIGLTISVPSGALGKDIEHLGYMIVLFNSMRGSGERHVCNSRDRVAEWRGVRYNRL
jgi:hypothetical protein